MRSGRWEALIPDRRLVIPRGGHASPHQRTNAPTPTNQQNQQPAAHPVGFFVPRHPPWVRAWSPRFKRRDHMPARRIAAPDTMWVSPRIEAALAPSAADVRHQTQTIHSAAKLPHRLPRPLPTAATVSPSNFLRTIIERISSRALTHQRPFAGTPGDAAHHEGSPHRRKSPRHALPPDNGYLHRPRQEHLRQLRPGARLCRRPATCASTTPIPEGPGRVRGLHHRGR